MSKDSTASTPLLVITGPTASGKTRRAVSVARYLNGEIISADSRQVYRSMDIGTGKDLDEYGEIPVHLIDICPAGYRYNLFEFLRDASVAVRDIASRNRVPIVCGGTGMYIESMINGMRLPEVPADPDLRATLAKKSLEELTDILSGMKHLHNTTDIDTAQRAIRAIEIEAWYEAHPEEARTARIETCTPRPALIIGVDVDRELRRQRITTRLYERLEQGMIEEVRSLLDSGLNADNLIYYGLEYKYLTLYLTGRMSRDEMIKNLEIAIHQFAKRQMTWFRGMERRGHTIHWLSASLSEEDFTDITIKLWSDYLAK